MKRFVLLVVLAGVVLAPTAAASERHPTLRELEGELMCPTCEGQTLEQSNAPVADRMRAFIRERIRLGDTKSEIKHELEEQFGPSVLAVPPKRGFGLLAWVLPLAGLAIGAVALAALAWRWSRGRERVPDAATPELNGRSRLDLELERRLDEELARFD
ncbi:MAG: cytochrome c-type biogenesis protein CcmH [Actinomycetota bacterium]|nr:cytochrome c-type biogenesis protein CcmH [Actinomycetota bacterium]